MTREEQNLRAWLSPALKTVAGNPYEIIAGERIEMQFRKVRSLRRDLLVLRERMTSAATRYVEALASNLHQFLAVASFNATMGHGREHSLREAYGAGVDR